MQQQKSMPNEMPLQMKNTIKIRFDDEVKEVDLDS